MPALNLIQGDERARKFLEEGASIADFLTDPLRPCVIRNSMGSIVALNKGSVDDSFFSCFWEQQISAAAYAYIVEYMADEPVILEAPKSYIPSPNKVDKFLAQRGACELAYDGSASDIRRMLVTKGFAVHGRETSTSKWEDLEEQKKANLSRRQDISQFYLGE